MPQNENQKNFKKFANNLRTTALGVKFAKTLYTDPSSLTPKQIATVLSALGYDVPKELIITAEVAQVIVAGQAVVEGAQAGADIGSATNATGAGVKVLTNIAEDQNYIDSDSASCIRIAVDVALIVSSFGTNIAAWVSLAMDLAAIGPGKDNLAKADAIRNAQAQYVNRISPQAAILGQTFKDFQEKKISVYGVIAKMAVETPDLWPQVIKPDSPFVQAFPDLMMLPVVEAHETGHGYSSISGDWPWPASGRYVIAEWNSYRTITFSTLGKSFNKEVAAEYFFESLIKPWVTCYAIANKEIVEKGNMKMEDVAALSYLVNPSGEISARDNYVNMLIGSCLTPYDFGDPILADISRQFVEEKYVGIDKTFHESAVSYGRNSLNQGFVRYNKDIDIMRLKLEKVKQSDEIEELVQYEYIYKKLQSYMDFQPVSFEKDPTVGGKLNSKFSEKSVTAWRKLHNYIAVMQMIDTYRTDSYLKNTQFAEKLLPFMPSADSFQRKINKLNYLSTARSVNKLAMVEIAKSVGVTVDKLVKVNKDDLGAAKFTIKG